MAVRTTGQRWRSRNIWYPLEGLILTLVYALFGLLSLDVASAIGGWIGRTLGPRLATSRKAERNLAMIFPAMDQAERRRIVHGMWDNLGRVITEFPNLRAIQKAGLNNPAARITVVGAEHITALAQSGQAGMFVSGHVGNWEMMALTLGLYGLPVSVVYREPNNPLAAKLLMRARRALNAHMIPKGRVGARELIMTLRKGGYTAMLVDQKMNDGIAVPFFDRPAMTASAVAELALKFRCPVVPLRCERLGGAHFRVTALPPLLLPDTGDRIADSYSLMLNINQLIESWIREHPEQWLWLHRRWPAESSTK